MISPIVNRITPDRVELLGAVEKALRLGLLGLRFFDHAHQLFYGGILRQLCNAHLESAGLVDGAREDRIAHLFRHRHRLAGQRRLVDGA